MSFFCLYYGTERVLYMINSIPDKLYISSVLNCMAF